MKTRPLSGRRLFGRGLQQRLLMSTSVAALAATVAVSDAETLAGSETDALAIVYTDDHFKATTGFNGSVYCLDSGTPANDYDSSPTTEAASYFTYTSPSPKMILHDDGVLKYNAHNLYLNSASPANQSITVVSSATYAVTITGSVSVTASGAATGTWTAGTNTFTAATTTLTLSSTLGSGTVHVRRTPSDSTYMETAGSIRYADPIELNSSGTSLGALVEPQRTNLVTNTSSASAWWIFGVGTSESADAAMAITGRTEADTVVEDTSTGVHQIYKSFDSSAGTYAISMFVEPAGRTHCSLALASGKWASFSLSGSGSVVKNSTGATGAIEKMSDTIYRISVVAAGANDLIVFSTSDSAYSGADAYGRASYTGDGTSGVNIYGTQIELGSAATSYIETYSGTVTRAADNIDKAVTAYAHSATVNSGMVEYVPKGSASTATVALRWDNGTANEVVSIGHDASGNIGLTVTDGGAAQTAPLTSGTVTNDATETIGFSWKANDFLLSDNGATAVADTSGTLPTVTTLKIGSSGGPIYVKRILIVPVEKTAAEVEAYGAL